MGLKQSIKQVLVEKQHRKYEAELSDKMMSYEDWILKQEKAIRVEDFLVKNWQNCLKNEKIINENDGRENKSAGLPSKKEVFREEWELKGQLEKKDVQLTADVFSITKMSKNVCEKILNTLTETPKDFVVLKFTEDELSILALPLIGSKFCENKNIILIYGDEDVKKDGHRVEPWLKPDWSPDTFLSYFYFGSMVACRGETLKQVLQVLLKEGSAWSQKEEESTLYILCEAVIRNAGGFAGHENLFEQVPVCHISEILVHTGTEGYNRIKDWRLYNKQNKSECLKNEKISVIIPSKDNPKVLFHCIHSFIAKTVTKFPYEILIMDNGSAPENKQEIEAEVLRLNSQIAEDEQKIKGGFWGIEYHYEPMVFNFSKMCNKGAGLAKGNLLLFLNDDMEIIQKDWLDLLAEKALLPYAGAVGAKLLYPESDIIQHAGITNLRVGPAHKLQFLEDTQLHYYGKNRGVHNMLAVTGACLLVRREVFAQTEGFREALAVAFNDVDLCYRIYEAGYYNVVRNDVKLYHHESLSRGKDGESEEKQQRLLREKDILYEQHQQLYGKDPFYHKYLTTDMLESPYSPAVRYQVTLDMPWAEVSIQPKLSDTVREDGCVVIGMEAAMDLYKWKYGVSPKKGSREPLPEEMGFYFQGYAFVIGSDNACYKKTLLLENKENKQIVKVPLDIRYRPDIKKNLKDQLNVDLTGYAAKVRLSDIPQGNYRFGMLAEDRCSRLKLVNWSSWTLSV